MLAKLKEYVSPRQPRIVLWFYYEGNDLTDLQREQQSMLLRNYLNDDRFTQSALLRQAGSGSGVCAIAALTSKARAAIENRTTLCLGCDNEEAPRPLAIAIRPASR